MASLANDQDPEQQTNQATAPQAGAPVTVGGTAGASSAGGQGNSGANGVGGAAPAGVSQVQQTQSPQTNSGYTDVASYLDANKAGSQQLGNTVASNLTGDFNNVKSGIDSSASNAQSLADQGYTHENSDLIAQAASNPIAAAADPNSVSAVQAQLNDTYTGPNSWGDYGTQQGNVAAGTQEGGLYNQAGGLNVLAQQAEGGVGGQGVNQLDTLLLGDPGAYSTVKAASDPFATLTGYLDNANTGVTGAITTGQNNAAKANADANAAFTGSNGAVTNLNNTVNTNTTNALTAAQQQQAQLKADIANLYGGQAVDTTASNLGGYGGTNTQGANTTNYNVGQLSPQDLQSLGITQDQWNSLQGSLQNNATSTYETGHNFGAGSGTSQIDPNQWLTQQDPSTLINANTVATPDQVAQMQAYQTLLGGTLPANTSINPALASLAGTYNPNQLNQFNYTDALNTSNQTEADAIAQAKAEAAGLTGYANQQHDASSGGFLKQTLGYNPFSGNFKDFLRYNLNPAGNLVPQVATAAGGVLGYIYGGGPAGGVLGAQAGNALGKQGLSDEKKYLKE